jgi:hypothetical protein
MRKCYSLDASEEIFVLETVKTDAGKKKTRGDTWFLRLFSSNAELILTNIRELREVLQQRHY